jgi:hypothetical protein
MISDLFNFKTSCLNPALKILVPLLFLLGSFYFFRLRNQYRGGALGQVVQRLAFVGLVGFLAHGFRYGADLWVMDNLKWGESLGYLLFAAANVYAVWPLLSFGQKVDAETLEDKK